MSPAELWAFLPLGYALTVLIETPVLLLGLSHRHSIGRRLLAGLWLTACTYPIVVVVLPLAIGHVEHPATYLVVAETFAPLAECGLFWAAFGGGTMPVLRDRALWRDWLVITAANVLSFVTGELLFAYWTP
jgi:hypothetical protein